MKAHQLLLARYNLWAHQTLCKEIDSLDSNALDQPLKSSFPTLRETLLHMYNAERVWIMRIQGESPERWPESDLQSFTTHKLIEVAKATLVAVEQLNEQDIHSLCTYSNLAGKAFQTPVSAILTHLFNHATYHRGQLVNMLRQLGMEALPSTDLITYLRAHSS